MYQEVDNGRKGQYGTTLVSTGHRTPALPKQVRYRAAPHPELSVNIIIPTSAPHSKVGRCAGLVEFSP
jgi:hypothetical protein